MASDASRHIVITGGSGFVGSHLVDAFLARGDRVTAVDNLITGSYDNVRHLEGRDDFSFVERDVSDGIGVTGDVEIEDGSGSITVERVGGSVTIDDGSGGIDVDDGEHDLIIIDDGSHKRFGYAGVTGLDRDLMCPDGQVGDVREGFVVV